VGRGEQPVRPAAGRRRASRWHHAAEGTSIYQTADPLAALEGDFEPRLVVERAEGHEPGVAYTCSTARCSAAATSRSSSATRSRPPVTPRFTRQGRTLVIEDLGSTNGTYLNDEALGGPQPLHDGDRIRIGDSEFSYFQ